ncbi:hypothetical protein ILYODFUR_035162 [Ilyodon furcidens]|uniref:Uncharacterized protein n=1 Tax=Ilyodon furcidens TaxID=33524 RepID=A0ABV0T629_9TELE
MEQSRIQDEGAGHPGAILRTVSLPFDKVLPPTAPPPGGRNPADSVGMVALEVPGGRRWHGRRAERTGLDRFQLGDMKNWVNPETGRQTKADRSGPTRDSITYGPMNLGESLRDRDFNGMSRSASQTL